MTTGLVRGMAAGAAGTTALNGATYLDMVLRGRGASSAPEDLVAAAADRAGVAIPGQGDVQDNRLAGLGPLSGIAVGVVVGGAAGVVHRFLHRHGRRIPKPVAVVAIGAAAMALSDVPLRLLGVSDPSDWAAKDWIADALPHLAYGVVTYSALQAAEAA